MTMMITIIILNKKVTNDNFPPNDYRLKNCQPTIATNDMWLGVAHLKVKSELPSPPI